MITDAMIREHGIDIGITLMPFTNPQAIPALQELSSVLVEADPIDELYRMTNNLFLGMLREVSQ